jgi:hypothetical protein
MHGHYITDARAGSSAGITGRPDSSDVAPHHSGYVAATRFFVAYELHSGRLDHCVGRFHHRRKTPALDHS